jgi:SAM-dependent methyltransferase
MTEPYYKQHWVEIDADRHSAYDQILAFHPAMEPMLRPLNLADGLRVLDVGSGPGHFSFELAKRVAPTGKVTGVDINEEFLERDLRAQCVPADSLSRRFLRSRVVQKRS